MEHDGDKELSLAALPSIVLEFDDSEFLLFPAPPPEQQQQHHFASAEPGQTPTPSSTAPTPTPNPTRHESESASFDLNGSLSKLIPLFSGSLQEQEDIFESELTVLIAELKHLFSIGESEPHQPDTEDTAAASERANRSELAGAEGDDVVDDTQSDAIDREVVIEFPQLGISFSENSIHLKSFNLNRLHALHVSYNAHQQPPQNELQTETEFNNQIPPLRIILRDTPNAFAKRMRYLTRVLKQVDPTSKWLPQNRDENDINGNAHIEDEYNIYHEGDEYVGNEYDENAIIDENGVSYIGADEVAGVDDDTGEEAHVHPVEFFEEGAGEEDFGLAFNASTESNPAFVGLWGDKHDGSEVHDDSQQVGDEGGEQELKDDRPVENDEVDWTEISQFEAPDVHSDAAAVNLEAEETLSVSEYSVAYNENADEEEGQVQEHEEEDHREYPLVTDDATNGESLPGQTADENFDNAPVFEHHNGGSREVGDLVNDEMGAEILEVPQEFETEDPQSFVSEEEDHAPNDAFEIVGETSFDDPSASMKENSNAFQQYDAAATDDNEADVSKDKSEAKDVNLDGIVEGEGGVEIDSYRGEKRKSPLTVLNDGSVSSQFEAAENQSLSASESSGGLKRLKV
ncbi:hypothetical protein BJ741DRAFT_707714 [Chytriomyces cf. hyalinus JEL632]|nr:hypothetical protein BJ741DRAFT_707714 [Chytriomyces cf. hyalinus JEL632]